MTFNGLKYLDDLTESGFTEQQAKAQLRILGEIIDSNLATKQDVELVRKDIEQVRSELKKDIELVRADLKRDIKASQFTIIISIGGLLVALQAIQKFITI